MDGPVVLQDFGDPTATTDVTACLVDDVGGDQTPRLHITASGGETCDGSPCWTASNSRFKYKRTRQAQNKNPVLKTTLASGRNRGVVKMVSRNHQYDDVILLPFSGTAVARIVFADDSCWEARYESPTLNLFESFSAQAP